MWSGLTWLWAVVVWCTVPFARPFRKWITEESVYGRDSFTYFVLTVLGLVGVGLVVVLGRRLRTVRLSGGGARRFGVLAAVLGFYIYETLQLQKVSPEEAMHFLQYGLLYVLAFRAFGLRYRQTPALVAAWLFCSFCGMVDEFVQWVVPKRYFDFRDIWLNSESAMLMGCLVAFAFRPQWLSKGWSGPAARAVTRWGSVCLVALGLLLSNRPSVVDVWANAIRLPPNVVSNLQKQEVAEYGHGYEDPAIGRFQSRLRPSELEEEDRTRGKLVSELLVQHRGPHSAHGYSEFLRAYPAYRDPYVHEARVHLYARDRNLEKRVNLRRAFAIHVQGADPSSVQVGKHTEAATVANARLYQEQTTVALREHRLLHTYFPTLMGHYPESKDAAWELALSKEALPQYVFGSRVSMNLFTRWRMWQFWMAIATSLLVLWGIDRMVKGSRVAADLAASSE